MRVIGMPRFACRTRFSSGYGATCRITPWPGGRSVSMLDDVLRVTKPTSALIVSCIWRGRCCNSSRDGTIEGRLRNGFGMRLLIGLRVYNTAYQEGDRPLDLCHGLPKTNQVRTLGVPSSYITKRLGRGGCDDKLPGM